MTGNKMTSSSILFTRPRYRMYGPLSHPAFLLWFSHSQVSGKTSNLHLSLFILLLLILYETEWVAVEVL